MEIEEDAEAESKNEEDEEEDDDEEGEEDNDEDADEGETNDETNEKSTENSVETEYPDWENYVVSYPEGKGGHIKFVKWTTIDRPELKTEKDKNKFINRIKEL